MEIFSKYRRVAAIGGLGFVGSYICRTLVAQSYKVRVISRASYSIALVKIIAFHIDIIRENISNSLEMLHLMSGADTVIHLVHKTVPGSSMENRNYDVSRNVLDDVRMKREFGWASEIRLESGIKKILTVSHV